MPFAHRIIRQAFQPVHTWRRHERFPDYTAWKEHETATVLDCRIDDFDIAAVRMQPDQQIESLRLRWIEFNRPVGHARCWIDLDPLPTDDIFVFSW